MGVITFIFAKNVARLSAETRRVAAPYADGICMDPKCALLVFAWPGKVEGGPLTMTH